jgi:type II secretory pathway component PulJ
MKPRGFAMIELMTVLMLFVVFIFVSSKVFIVTIRQMRDVPAGSNRIASIEQIRQTLSRDLWSAVEIKQSEEGSLLLLDGNGILTTWRKDSEGTLIRSAVDHEAKWFDLKELSFRREPEGVVLEQRKRTWTLPTPLLREEKP